MSKEYKVYDGVYFRPDPERDGVRSDSGIPLSILRVSPPSTWGGEDTNISDYFSY